MSENNNLKLAVVTGAAHRMGRHFALSLAQQGYAIVLHYFSSEIQARETFAEIQAFGTPVYPYKADLRIPDEINNMWEYIDTLKHEVQVLINSAAIMNKGDIRSLTTQEFDESISINLRAPLLCAQEASKRMSKGGLIINISDVGANMNWVGFPAYSISKAGLETLTRILAKALAPDIRVNAIAPGLVIPSVEFDSVEWEKLINKIPLKRPASPKEITSLMEYLINNTYITGQVIDVDGGYSLRY
jgi:NAD(P)-dependent dehydrogenase (short-subunit alcohol dehydrogenase family)